MPSASAGTSSKRFVPEQTQNNILIPLRAVFAMACKGTNAPPNPTDGIKCLKVQSGNPDPFTAEEVEAIVTDLRKPRVHTTGDQAAALADYFEFAFFAGLRPSEQIAMLWGDVDLRNQTLTIRRSRVMKQEKDRTQTHRSRNVELNDRAAAVIERQRARTQLTGGKVSLNPWTGRAWNNGEEQRRDWMSCLKRIGVRHRPPKECRDTSVTLSLQAGADQYTKTITPDGEVSKRIRAMPISEWRVRMPEHHEGYLTAEEFERNQQRLANNRTNAEGTVLSGPAREGLALLQGLLLCSNCGRSLTVRYRGNGGIYPTYDCNWKRREGLATKSCMSVRTDLLDANDGR